MRPSITPTISAWIKANTGKHQCMCGCGEFVTPTIARFYRNRSLRFVDRHQNRGVNHPHYKGGVVRAKGYVWILQRNHPRTTPRGYVKRCWLVAEQKIGRFLRPDEVVHHIDHNKLNDAPNNLAVISRVEHAKHHYGERTVDRDTGQLRKEAA